MRKVVSVLIGVGVLVVCGMTAVEAGSWNMLFPEGTKFPNPLRKAVPPGQTAATDSTGSQSNAATLLESNCGLTTDYLGITDGECENEQASLHLNGPNSLLVESPDGEVITKGNSGAVFVGSTESCDLTPGVILAAYSPNTQNPVRAGLLLTTCPGDDSSWAWLAVADEGGAPVSSLIMLYPGGIANPSYTFMDTDRFSLTSSTIALSNGSAAGISINQDSDTSVTGNTVNVSNTTGSGVSVDANGNAEMGNDKASITVDSGGSVIIRVKTSQP